MAPSSASPVEVASDLLTNHGGIQRNAEVEAWKRRDQFRQDEQGYEFWVQVALNIVNKTEYPKVDRKEYRAPAPAFKQLEARV